MQGPSFWCAGMRGAGTRGRRDVKRGEKERRAWRGAM